MNKLLYIPLGGAGRVTQNMHAFESENEILIIDSGIGFPEAAQLGVDVLIPDVSYLRNKVHKIRGIVISHAHEDHIGGLPYVLRDLGPIPVYAAKLPRAFIQNKLVEFNMLTGQPLNLIEPEKGSFRLGEFELTPYRVNHSVPDSLGFFIRTPIGNIVYSPDFKFDWTPVDGRLFEIGKVAQLAEQGVMALFSDCLGSNREGYTETELTIQRAFEREMEHAPNQVFISTVSSNISRMQQAINASRKYGRRVVPIGRSIEQNMEIALNLGYLNAPKESVIKLGDTRRIPGRKLTYLIAGSYGQKGSALERLSRDEVRDVKLRENAVIIFSADPIPGIADQVNTVVDNLTERRARVVYSEIQDDLHVSGHGSQGDLSMMIGVARPKYFVPIGGSSRHQHSYRMLVERMGFDGNHVFEVRRNETVEFSRDGAKLGPKVETKDVFVDGSLVGDVGKKVLEDRLKLAEEGIVVVILKKGNNGMLDARSDIISRGFVYVVESKELINKAQQVVSKNVKNRKAADWQRVRTQLERELSSFFYRETKRRPMILPVLVNV